MAKYLVFSAVLSTVLKNRSRKCFQAGGYVLSKNKSNKYELGLEDY